MIRWAGLTWPPDADQDDVIILAPWVRVTVSPDGTVKIEYPPPRAH